MRSILFSYRRTAAFLLALAIILCAATLRAEPREPQLASATAKELWRKGSDQVLAGDFPAALATLEQVQKIEPGHSEVAAAVGWMREAKALNESRERLRARAYDHYVKQAAKYAQEAREPKTETPGDETDKVDASKKKDDKKTTSKQNGKEDEDDDQSHKWSRALFASQAAMLNAKNEEAFREEPWLNEIVDNVREEIERHKKNREWKDALVLYDVLGKLYPKNKEYQDGYTYCVKRVHMDFVYGSKSTWRSDLRDVTPATIPQILDRIEDDYVEEVDFRKLCTSALEHLIILAEAESLSETFPTLGDDDLVNNFVTRLRGLMKNKVQSKGGFATRQMRQVFDKVLEANADSLRLPEAVLVDEYVAGALEPLDDFTSVIWPSQVDDFNKHTRGDFVGVGIQITQDIGKPVRVESPLEDSPAYRAGIKPGDLIVKVDGKKTEEMTVNQAVTMITGEPGSNVTLTISDPIADTSRDIVLKRERIKIRTVRGFERNETNATGWDYLLDPGSRIAYVRVSGFMDKTVEDLEKALIQIRKDGARGLILDLRFNPGGLLTSAVQMSELFMKRGEQIVMTKGRSRQQNMEISSKAEENFNDLPLVVLVNEYSASASEIVAGALAGLKEACIVGARTFGKGSVQNLIPIADNQAYLKLTTAKYYVPDTDSPENPWYCLHRDKTSESWGVEPNINVKVIPQELTKILRLRREKDLLKGKDQSAIPREVLERRPTSEPADDLPTDEDPNTDPQLAAALNMLRIRLVSNQPWAFAPRPRAVASTPDGEPKTKSSAQR